MLTILGTGSINENQNAGEIDQALLRKVFAVNFDGLVHVTTTFLPLLRKAKDGYGAILNVSSILGSNEKQAQAEGNLHMTAYNASKAAVNSYTISLSWELCKHNIKVNCVHPGWTSTRINNFNPTAVSAEEGAKVLLPWALLGPEDKDKTGMYLTFL